MSIRAVRYHDFSAGHRVVGHENKCRWLHGHNYRVTFFCEAEELDGVGRVIDFGVIKSKLCEWLERRWDHKFLIWKDDPMLKLLQQGFISGDNPGQHLHDSLHITPFNPTAENMGRYLLEIMGPELLADAPGVKLTKVIVEETRKCSAEVSL